MKFTAKQIAAYIDGQIIGNEEAEVYTFAKIEGKSCVFLNPFELIISFKVISL